MVKINIASEDEAGDLADWLFGHIEQAPPGAEKASDWLCEAPVGISEVPDHLLAAIEWAIDDWGEVMAFHREAFETTLVK